jgi:transcriptional regulator with XRE-family HTH domain
MNTRKIKDLMKEKNMSIYRLSKETGISDSLLGKILNGKVENPRIQTVKQIAKALNVAINEIVNMD